MRLTELYWCVKPNFFTKSWKMLTALRPRVTWLSIQSRWTSHAEGVATGFGAGGQGGGFWSGFISGSAAFSAEFRWPPGGFCLPLDAPDRFAIHPEHPLNLALAFARLQ